MEGYDLKLIGSLYTHPVLQKKYGARLSNGSHQISAALQADLTNGATVGSLIGLVSAGIILEKISFCKTMLLALALITLLIFIPFFSPSIEALQLGQILMGIPWGTFQTLATAYAVEVAANTSSSMFDHICESLLGTSFLASFARRVPALWPRHFP